MEEREAPGRRSRPGDLPFRPGNAASPDRLPAPVLLVGIGGFGHEVLSRLEAHAAGIAEVLGPESIRNLATLRVLTRAELVEANRHGFRPEGELRRGMFFRQEEPRLAAGFGPDGPLAVAGFDVAGGGREEAPLPLLGEQICELAAVLFRADRFVDFHADTDQFVSRLDVFVVSEAGHPLGYGGHVAVQEALAGLAGGRLKPLFPPHRANLALNHLVSFPLVRLPESNEQVRRLVLRYRAHLQELGQRLRPIPSKFVFLEDRSHKYVLKQEQMALLFASWLRLLTFERTGQGALLRRLIEPIPDIERLRHKGFSANNICAAFSVASVEAPLYAILRYCRNRQAIGVLNVFLDRAQDGEPPRPEFEEPAALAEERVRRYGREGTLEQELAGCFSKRIVELEKDRRNQQRKRGLGPPWGMADVGEWEYHGNLVEPFHNDLFEPGSPKYTLSWLKRWRDRIIGFLEFLVKEVLRDVFAAVEKAGEEMSHRLLAEERKAVDALVTSGPAGWKQALRRLEHVVRLLKERGQEASDRVVSTKLESISARQGLRGCKQQLEGFEDAVDGKPVRERLLRYAGVLGVVSGVSVLMLVASLLPVHPVVTVALGLSGAPVGYGAAAWLARRYNRGVVGRLAAVIASDPSCSMQRGLEGSCDELYRLDHPDSFVGERVEWTYQLWKLRFYARVVEDLERDLERLRDIGRILEIQLNRFRSDQEAVGVQFHQEGTTLREDPARVISFTETFCQAMFSSERLEGLYAHFAQEPERMARTYEAEQVPFAAWRSALPFAYYRELTDFLVVPFLPLQGVDFLSFRETAEEARGRVKAFLGDFSHKMEVNVERRAGQGGTLADEERLVVLHRELLPAVRELFRELEWPPGWGEVTELPGRHGVYLVRAVDGLAPWELAAVGDQLAVVGELIGQGLLDALVDVVRLVDSPNLKTSMVAVALSKLVPGRTGTEGWEVYPRRLLEEFLRMRAGGERPLDGSRFVPAGSAGGWIEPLAGEPGVLPLVARLYGTAMDESGRPFEEALARSRLLLLAARGEPAWAYKELKKLPEGWAHPFVASLIHAETVVDFVLQERLPEAMELLCRLKPDAVQASCLLRVAILLAGRQRVADAGAFLDLAFVPEGDGLPAPPVESRPDFLSLLSVFEALRGHPKLCLAMVAAFGGSEFAHLDAAEETDRVRWLLQAAPRQEAGALLRLLDEFPGERVDARLVGRVRRTAL